MISSQIKDQDKPIAVDVEKMSDFSFEDSSTYYRKPKIVLGALERVKKTVKTEDCRMSNCFDFEVCRRNGFKIYVYPQQIPPSSVYANILSSIKNSPYYTGAVSLIAKVRNKFSITS